MLGGTLQQGTEEYEEKPELYVRILRRNKYRTNRVKQNGRVYSTIKNSVFPLGWILAKLFDPVTAVVFVCLYSIT